MKYTEAGADAGGVRWISEIADLKYFSVDVIGDFAATRREGQPAFVAVERCHFVVILSEKFQALKTRRSGEVAIALDGKSHIAAGNRDEIQKRASFKHVSRRSPGAIEIVKRKQHLGLHDFRQINDRCIVDQPRRLGRVLDDVVLSAETNFFAVLVENESHGGIDGLAGLIDRCGRKLREKQVPVGRPAKRIDVIGERGGGALKFLADEDAAALATRVLDPDVVVL